MNWRVIVVQKCLNLVVSCPGHNPWFWASRAVGGRSRLFKMFLLMRLITVFTSKPTGTSNGLD